MGWPSSLAYCIGLVELPQNVVKQQQFQPVLLAASRNTVTPPIDPPPDCPVLIAGPTASGKSQLAMQIADQAGGVIVNADALQVFDCWRVLTARPTSADEARHPHRLYGHIGREQSYSVGHWLREVQGILETGQRPIIVGGTGLYFTALTSGLAAIPDIPLQVREIADARRLAGGIESMLAELDTLTRAQIDPRNPARVQRAWEVATATGRGLAEWQRDTPAPMIALADCAAIVLQPDRDWLANRIDARFDMMILEGALDEVRAALPFWQPEKPWAQAIGAPELIAYLQGELLLEDAATAAKAASRQYAKRQRTWFRNRMKGWQTVVPQ
jgi:tRNA dimethylallyltransferase